YEARFVGRDRSLGRAYPLGVPCVSDVGLDVEAEAPDRGCDKSVISLPADRVVIRGAGGQGGEFRFPEWTSRGNRRRAGPPRVDLGPVRRSSTVANGPSIPRPVEGNGRPAEERVVDLARRRRLQDDLRRPLRRPRGRRLVEPLEHGKEAWPTGQRLAGPLPGKGQVARLLRRGPLIEHVLLLGGCGPAPLLPVIRGLCATPVRKSNLVGDRDDLVDPGEVARVCPVVTRVCVQPRVV